MVPILEIKNVKKKYNNFCLNNINLTLECGYIMGFIGPNGAGKSTTIKLIMNLIRKDEGEIKVFGQDHIRNEIEIKNKIGFVLDENHFYEEITVAEMKNIIAPFYLNWDETVFNKYIKEFQLPLHKKIKELSKGMKMKLSLSVALSHNARLLIMDEPTSGLDPVVRSEFLDILTELIQDEKKGIFFSTHITSDLDRIADYITFINEGEIVFSETKDGLLENYGIIKGPKELTEMITDKNLIGVRENRYGFEALVRNKNEVLRLCKEKVVVEKPTLEDIMVYFTRRNKNAAVSL